jgi:arsenite methyltransferase
MKNKNEEVKKKVRKAYSKVATNSNSCCCSCGCGSADTQTINKISKNVGYSDEELNIVPEANLGLGCGNPTAFSSIKEGDVVLDLGSGPDLIVSWLQGRLGKRGKLSV